MQPYQHLASSLLPLAGLGQQGNRRCHTTAMPRHLTRETYDESNTHTHTVTHGCTSWLSTWHAWPSRWSHTRTHMYTNTHDINTCEETSTIVVNNVMSQQCMTIDRAKQTHFTDLVTHNKPGISSHRCREILCVGYWELCVGTRYSK